MESMVQIPYRRGSVDTPHLFFPVEDGSNPGGGGDAPNNLNPPFLYARERERLRPRKLPTPVAHFCPVLYPKRAV